MRSSQCFTLNMYFAEKKSVWGHRNVEAARFTPLQGCGLVGYNGIVIHHVSQATITITQTRIVFIDQTGLKRRFPTGEAAYGTPNQVLTVAPFTTFSCPSTLSCTNIKHAPMIACFAYTFACQGCCMCICVCMFSPPCRTRCQR